MTLCHVTIPSGRTRPGYRPHGSPATHRHCPAGPSSRPGRRPAGGRRAISAAFLKEQLRCAISRSRSSDRGRPHCPILTSAPHRAASYHTDQRRTGETSGGTLRRRGVPPCFGVGRQWHGQAAAGDRDRVPAVWLPTRYILPPQRAWAVGKHHESVRYNRWSSCRRRSRFGCFPPSTCRLFCRAERPLASALLPARPVG